MAHGQQALTDWAYVMNHAKAITLGQKPYLDFGLVLPPGTFYIQALLMKIFGASFWVSALYVAISAGVSSWLVLLILSRLGLGLSLLISSSFVAVFAASIQFSQPFYDNDAALVSLAVIFATLLLVENKLPMVLGVLTVPFAFSVLTFKQTSGSGFFLGYSIWITFVYWKMLSTIQRKHFLLGFFSMLMVLVIICSLAFIYAGDVLRALVENIYTMPNRGSRGLRTITQGYNAKELIYLSSLTALGFGLMWTASKIFEKLPRLGTFKENCVLSFLGIATICAIPFGLGMYYFETGQLYSFSVLSTSFFPIALVLFAFFILLNFRSNLVFLARFDTYDNEARLQLHRLCIGILVSGMCLSNFASSGYWGSTYALWGHLIILIVVLLKCVPASARLRTPFLNVFHGSCLTISIFLVILVLNQNFRIAIYTFGSLPLTQSSQPILQGMKIKGDWLKEFDALIDWTEKNVPKEDRVASLPGEDPFYFASARAIPVFYNQIVEGSYPHKRDWIVSHIKERAVDWVIIKTKFQAEYAFRDFDQLAIELSSDYELVNTGLKNYIVMRRSSNP